MSGLQSPLTLSLPALSTAEGSKGERQLPPAHLVAQGEDDEGKEGRSVSALAKAMR